MEGRCETHAATQDPGPSLSQNLSQNPEGGMFVSLEASGSSRSLEVPGMYRLERERRGIFLTSILPGSKVRSVGRKKPVIIKSRSLRKRKQEENTCF